jgi:hypothetical protein
LAAIVSLTATLWQIPANDPRIAPIPPDFSGFRWVHNVRVEPQERYMPIVYIYEASDFTTGIPAEASSGAAVGSPTFTLTLSPTATPIAVEISDNDGNLEETDTSQTLAADVTINGVTYTAGTPIVGAYSLTDSGSGEFVTGIHIGAGVTSLSYSGPALGVMSSQVLTPGATYTFDGENSTWTNPVPYADFVACFTKGTLIDTAAGPVAIEDLTVGDRVVTRDSGLAAIRWIGKRTVPATGKMAPVVFSKGAIGNDAELAVSPQHRMFLSGWRCELLFGSDEVLAPAVHLVNGETIWRREGGEVTNYHILFDRHEIVSAHGTQSESFHPTATNTGAFEEEARDELLTLFPELTDLVEEYGPTARPVLKGFETRVLEANLSLFTKVARKDNVIALDAWRATRAEMPQAQAV